MADRLEAVATTSTADVHRLHARQTITIGMTYLGARMSASKQFPTWLVATRNRIRALLPILDAQVNQGTLSASTMCNHIGRSWTVGVRCLLGMALLLATVLTAVVDTVADLTTVEYSNPFVALLLFLLIRTCHFLLDFSTVALRFDLGWTSSANTRVTRPLASMFTTWQHIATNSAAAPAKVVVGLHTLSLGLFLPAKADLFGSHGRARRAWSSMAHEVARMGTCFWELSFATTGLSA
jgi:hypothetical protein